MSISLAFALILSVVPLPLGKEWLRPEFLLMTLLFWNLFFPYKGGIMTSFFWGIGKDISIAGILGQHALSYAIITYLALKLSRRVLLYPLWQQAICVGLLLGFHQLIILWINTLLGKTLPAFWLYWIPSLLGVVIWPWAYQILSALSLRLKIK